MADSDQNQKRDQEQSDKRRFERFKASLVVRFRLITSSEKSKLMKSGGYAAPGAFMAKAAETQDLSLVVSEDISLGGLKIPSLEPLTQGAELWVNLGISSVPIPVNALAKVMWSRPKEDGGFQSGLKFNAINQADLAKVEGFLASRPKQD